MPWLVQIIVIGFLVGLAAQWLSPGPRRPAGFVLTTVLGIVGAVLATRLGRAFGWLEQNELAGIVEMIVGAVIVTSAWNMLAAYWRTRSVAKSADRNVAPLQ